MKHTLFAALLTVLAALGSSAPAAEVYDLTTITGKTYLQCHVMKVEMDGVSFRHSKGTAKVLFKDLTQDWRKHFGYDPEKAKAHEDKLRADKARLHDVAVQKANDAMKAQQEAFASMRDAQALAALQNMAFGGGSYGYAYPVVTLNGSVLPDGSFFGANAFNGSAYYYAALRNNGCSPLRSLSNCQPFMNRSSHTLGMDNHVFMKGSTTPVTHSARSHIVAPQTFGYTPAARSFSVPGIGPNVSAAPRAFSGHLGAVPSL